MTKARREVIAKPCPNDSTNHPAFGVGTLPYFIVAVLKGTKYPEVKGETYASLSMKVRQEG